MTPNDIEVLLHYYAYPKPHPRFGAPAVLKAINHFVRDGILQRTAEDDDGLFHATERGKALVEMLCNTPYPEQVWIDPRTQERIKPC